MSHNTINILFLGGAKRVSISRLFIEAGKRLGYEVNIFSYELENNVPISIVGKIILGEKWESPTILQHLHETVEKHNINILIPFVDGAVAVAAAYRDSYHDVWVPIGKQETAEAMFDKVASAILFEQAGLPIPRSYMKGKPVFPMIAKPRFGSASKGIKIISNPRDFRKATADSTKYLLQEYISNSEEYTVDCYVSANREIICTVPRRRIEVVGGEVSRSVTVSNNLLIAMAHTVLRRLDLRGAATIQFINDIDNKRLLLMEINPRIGGGAVCSIHAGADIPSFMLKEYLGMPLKPCTNWRAGVEITRYMQEVVFYNENK